VNSSFWLDLGVVKRERKGCDCELLERSFIGYYNEDPFPPKTVTNHFRTSSPNMFLISSL
jgi:hypothetical protein